MSVDPLYLELAHGSIVISLALITGIAVAMYVWMIPMIKLAPSTQSKVRQFARLIQLGARYQQTGSRIIALALLVLAYLSYNHNQAPIQQRWPIYGVAIVLLVCIAPYETYMIFPTNDRLLDMGGRLIKDKMDNFEDGQDAEVDLLLDSWRSWHIGRIMAPLAVTCFLMFTPLVA